MGDSVKAGIKKALEALQACRPGMSRNQIDSQMNAAKGQLQRLLDDLAPPPVPSTNKLCVPGYTSDTWYYAIKFPKNTKIYVTRGRARTVSSVAQEIGADVIINGQDYKGGHVTGVAASNGVIYSAPKKSTRPFFNVTEDNIPEIRNSQDGYGGLYNAVCGRRYLVQNGVIAPSSAAWKERHPYTCIGISYDGEIITILNDGRTAQSKGLSLFEIAGLFIRKGARSAIDLSGGGDTTLSIGGIIANVPIHDGVPFRERKVANHICFWLPKE